MRSAKILLVDDEEDLCLVLGEILTRIGYEVQSAHEGFETLRRVEEFEPDLVVMNRMMPGLRGDEVAEELLRRNVSVRVIIASGCASRAFARDYYRLGVCDFLIKPFGLPDLLASIERSLATDQTMIGVLATSRAGTVPPEHPFGWG